ncbi:hypothetical protein FisN_1Lh167 [Fistulifera solaris]|uniref:Uncharacterized protein n=1 Tax=Fistulifera solaris TaxID=1519565 RepID=A0A1Z5K5F8_FISSO|nr:hypothetical protein FisN_1Lh167 [Fistulifera solaris]|eukprot:GAX21331.1 hypothetical protein FisN_1Lh167 [Fistulifera solaris]
MPLLMHGAGDVVPNEVNPDTAALLAALTTHYMEQLVQAAIDAHQMSRDNNSKDPSLPPRSLQKSLQPPLPSPPEPVFPRHLYNSLDNQTTHKRKRRSTIQYWDEPLPEPKIGDETVRNESSSSSSPPEDADTWVGLAGVDFFHDRTRMAYVQAPAALTTQSFIFPLCHDTYTYGRIVEQQAFKQSLEPVLVDRVVMEMVQAEGQQQHARALKKNKTGANNNKKKNHQEKDGNASDPEDEDGDLSVDEEEEKDIPTWPGLDSIIPF